jgi:hypothetical protein
MTKMQYVHENPDHEGRDEWNYSADSAVWYLEASINIYFSYYYYLSSQDSVEYFNHIDSTKLPIVAGDEGYNILELQQKFSLISESILSLYDSIDGGEKFFLLADVSEITDDSIQVYYVCGSSIGVTIPEDYFWASDLGLCAGGNYGLDATDIICGLANAPYPPYPSTLNSCHYYTDEVSVGFTRSGYGANWLYTYQYYGSTLIHPCIYGNEELDLASLMPGIGAYYHPGGNIYPLHYALEGIMSIKLSPYNNNDYGFYHYVKIVYGITHMCTIPPPVP